MFAKQIDLQETETTVEELLALIQEGGEVIFTKGDTPVARITSIETPEKRSGSPQTTRRNNLDE